LKIKEVARYLQQKQTPAEKQLWNTLRNRQIKNKKFLRQHPIVFIINNENRFFIADFYCAEYKLVVELDGRIHDRQIDYDEMRTWIIEELGYKVIRFKNDEVEKKFDGVIERIKIHLL